MKNTVSNPWWLFCLVFILAGASVAVADDWECAAENGGSPQSLKVSFSGNEVTAVHYSSMSPAGDGTMLSCPIDVTKGDGKSEWQLNSHGVLRVAMKDSMAKKDEIRVRRDGDNITVLLRVSASNCGHSTPRAKKIAISRGNKTCHDVEMAD